MKHAYPPLWLLIPTIVSALFVTACGDKTLVDLLDGDIDLPPQEIAAIQALTRGATIARDTIPIVEETSWNARHHAIAIAQGHIVRIALGHAGIKDISKLGKLSHLRSARLPGNAIREAIGFCTAHKLKELDLRDNQLVKLDPHAGCTSL